MTDKLFGWVPPFMQTPRRKAALDRFNAADVVADQATAALLAAKDSAAGTTHLASGTYVRLQAEYDAAQREVQAAIDAINELLDDPAAQREVQAWKDALNNGQVVIKIVG